ncbi:MAG: HIT domain-containing protein [Patescibacteria group bacterium]
MHNHAPKDYTCPLCLPAQGIENEHAMMKQADIFYRDDLVVAAINSKFVGKNPGHVIIFPTKHFENIYDLPDEVAARVVQVAKRIAIAMKEIRKCDGITTQQNNEPAGGQHAFHYHFHIFPRWENDGLFNNPKDRVSDPEERVPYAEAFQKYLEKNPIKF